VIGVAFNQPPPVAVEGATTTVSDPPPEFVTLTGCVATAPPLASANETCARGTSSLAGCAESTFTRMATVEDGGMAPGVVIRSVASYVPEDTFDGSAITRIFAGVPPVTGVTFKRPVLAPVSTCMEYGTPMIEL